MLIELAHQNMVPLLNPFSFRSVVNGAAKWLKDNL